MEHRALLNGMSDMVLSGYAAVPYHVDPMLEMQTPANDWSLNHQQAHNDALAALPQLYFYGFLNVPDPIPVGIRPGAVLIDANLTDEMQRQWWTFANQIEHTVAAATIAYPFDLFFPRW